MSFNFTVQNVIDFPNGKYRAQIDHMEYVISDYGNYPLVHFKMIGPEEFEGRILKKKFNIEHQNSITKHIAIKDFSKFCIDIGNVKVGEDPTADDFIYKIVDLDIENKTGSDGRVYTNIIRIELVDKQTDEIKNDVTFVSTSYPPQKNNIINEISNQPLNDEVHF